MTKKSKIDLRSPKLIAPVALIVIILLIVLAIVFIPKMTASTDSKNASDSKQQVTVTTKKPMPSDATKSATDYLMKLVKQTNDKVPSDFLTKSSETLNKFGDGDTSALPDSIKNRFVFSDDIKESGKTVDENMFKASAYMGLIMSAQAYRMVTASQTVKIDYDLAYVNPSAKRVYIPSEAFLSYPINVTFELVWTDDGWMVDGDSIGVSMSANLRKSSYDLQQEKSQSSSSSGSSSSSSSSDK